MHERFPLLIFGARIILLPFSLSLTKILNWKLFTGLCHFNNILLLSEQMLDGLVKRIALDFDVENIAKAAKASKETKIAEVGADIELLAKQS